MWIRFLHAIGLTNLSDSHVTQYESIDSQRINIGANLMNISAEINAVIAQLNHIEMAVTSRPLVDSSELLLTLNMEVLETRRQLEILSKTIFHKLDLGEHLLKVESKLDDIIDRLGPKPYGKFTTFGCDTEMLNRNLENSRVLVGAENVTSPEPLDKVEGQKSFKEPIEIKEEKL